MKKPLLYYGGQGYAYTDEIGTFEVKIGEIETKKFSKLSEARLYYDSINEEKAMWDMTKIPKLLEAHTF